MSDLLDQLLPRTSQQSGKKIIQLEESEEFLSNDQMPAQATANEATIIRAPDQRLVNIIEIQDPQNIQSSQSTIRNTLKQHSKSQRKTSPQLQRI